MPGWTFIEESSWSCEEHLAEVSDHIAEVRELLDALAAEWTAINSQREQESFRRQFDAEEGRGLDYEYPECPVCGDGSPLGFVGSRRRAWPIKCFSCGEFKPGAELFGITCPHCKGEGYDVVAVREWGERARRKRLAEDLRLEIVERMLAHHGARIMRPYEHWNEEERLVEYLETRRDHA